MGDMWIGPWAKIAQYVDWAFARYRIVVLFSLPTAAKKIMECYPEIFFVLPNHNTGNFETVSDYSRLL